VGPAGWHYQDWEGIVYPRGGGKSFDPLFFLASYVDTVEINSSFYAPPRPQDAMDWARRVRGNPGFKFTAKAWQRITHGRREAVESGSLPQDCEEIRRSFAPLLEADLLGALLLQFPWSFKNTEANLDYIVLLKRYLNDFPLVLEVRHGSWEDRSFYFFLKEKRISFCNVDQPVIGDSIRPGAEVTARIGYFRLHGRNYERWFDEKAGRDARYDYLYTREEVVELSHKIAAIKQEADETYVITNNHFRGQALVNAFEILQELDSSPPVVPPLLAESYPGRL
jgi:uncharacterized protein YecE (DUF72 family)